MNFIAASLNYFVVNFVNFKSCLIIKVPTRQASLIVKWIDFDYFYKFGYFLGWMIFVVYFKFTCS